jgi:glycosyltransferase involved in cell wall biosynthesis
MSVISVIIPTFNNSPYIAEAIASVQSQTVPANEIIVVDDGSTDGTEAIVRAITDPRIQYHRQENCGVSVARNRGLDHATGTAIAFLDADDRWRPTMLEQQSQLLASNPALVCCFADFVRFVNETGEIQSNQFTFFPELDRLRTHPLPNGRGHLIADNAFDQIIPFGEFPAFMLTMLFRAERIRGLRFNRKLVRCQDADFVLRAMLRGQVAYSPAIVADVRRHGLNATSQLEMMSLDKLRALECVREDPMATAHLPLLERRIARAQFDATAALLKRRQFGEALSYWQQALRSRSSPLRKVRGSVRLALILLASVGKAQPRSVASR